MYIYIHTYIKNLNMIDQCANCHKHGLSCNIDMIHQCYYCYGHGLSCDREYYTENKYNYMCKVCKDQLTFANILLNITCWIAIVCLLLSLFPLY